MAFSLVSQSPGSFVCQCLWSLEKDTPPRNGVSNVNRELAMGTQGM